MIPPGHELYLRFRLKGTTASSPFWLHQGRREPEGEAGTMAGQSTDRVLERHPKRKRERGQRIILDPDRAILVREAFRLYATGEYSLAGLQSELAAKGLTSPAARRPGAPPPVSTLARALANPFNIGIVEWDEIEYPGKHKPLVTRGLFERVQDVLHSRNKAGVRKTQPRPLPERPSVLR